MIQPRLLETHRFSNGYTVLLLELGDIYTAPEPYMVEVIDPHETAGPQSSRFMRATKTEAVEKVKELIDAHLNRLTVTVGHYIEVVNLKTVMEEIED